MAHRGAAASGTGAGDEVRRVVWLVDALKLGGAERLALRFAGAAPAGWRVELVALQPPPEGTALPEIWGPELERAVGRVSQLAMRHLADGREWLRLLALLRRWRPALVHTHLRYATVWGGAAARVLGIPHVTTVHLTPGEEPSRRQRWAAAWERAIRRRAARVIYVSRAQRAAWGAAPERERALVIGNGVAAGTGEAWAAASGACDPAGKEDGTAEKQARRRERGIAAAAFVVATVAVVRARKGWRTWLAAVEAVAARRPEAVFIWVGGGPEWAALREAAAASRWGARIVLPGPRADVGAWLGLSDLFLFPSEEEAQPTAVMEAMAAGVPVIASKLPAIAEVLGGSGRLVGPGEAAALAAAVLEASAPEAEAWREAAAAAGRRRVTEKYGEAAWQRRLLELYADIIEGKPWDGQQADSDGRVLGPRRAAAL